MTMATVIQEAVKRGVMKVEQIIHGECDSCRRQKEVRSLEFDKRVKAFLCKFCWMREMFRRERAQPRRNWPMNQFEAVN